MSMPRFAFAVLVLLLASPVQAQQSSAAGRVKVASGNAVVVLEGRSIAAAPVLLVFETWLAMQRT